MPSFRLSSIEAIFIVLLFSSYTFRPDQLISQKSPKATQSAKTEVKGFWNADLPQADSVFASMSLDEKIGQLFMVAAYTNRTEAHITEIKNLIKNENIGGLIFFQDNARKEIELTNTYQGLSKVPLLIGIDGEWGLSMRLKNTPEYPKQMALGAIRDSTLLYQMGAEMAVQFKRLGIHVNFAPVVDVNVNPKNPVINYRSFGENKTRVANLAWQYAKGMEDNGLMACLKHFPGHGDTDSDSHKSLPTIIHNLQRLKDVELYPFQELFDNGAASSVMVGHLNIPALKTEGQASTLSANVVSTLLRDSMGFNGLAYTDALNMKGVSAYFQPGDVDLMALKAGNDVLLFPEDVPKAKAKIKAAIADGSYSEEALNKHVMRILKAKAYFGALNFTPLDTLSSEEQLFSSGYYALVDKLYEANLVLLKNQDNILPLSLAESKRAVLFVNRKNDEFFDELKKYNPGLKPFLLTSNATEEEKYRLFFELNQYQEIVVHYGNTSHSPSKSFGFSTSSADFLSKLASKNKVVFIWNGNTYGLAKLKNPEAFEAIICAHTENGAQQMVLAQALLGTRNISGKLAVSVPEFAQGSGIELKKTRDLLNNVQPEQVGVDSYKLSKVDSIVNKAIADMAMPGCQIFVSRKGKIILNKSYGHFTYDKTRAVSNNDLYDLASLTKILASTISIMKLYDEGKIDLDAPIVNYLPSIPTGSPYSQLILRDILLHQAGLHSWIPFYKDFLADNELYNASFKNKSEGVHSVVVASEFFTTDTMPKWVYSRIFNEPIRSKKKYAYSDLGFYIIKAIVEHLSGENFDAYVQRNFYQPMGLKNLTYNPLKRFSSKVIAPTEYDADFRKQLVLGHVHDQGAALLGGVSGHAGLFGNAQDVAAIMQMLLNGGEYAGERLLQRGTIEYFTRSKSFVDKDNRRALGFDKPSPIGDPGPTFDGISFKSFGHSGFTGTFAWADPEEEIVYVFLSNRVYPSAENKKLIRGNVRSEIQKSIYQAIEGGKYDQFQ